MASPPPALTEAMMEIPLIKSCVKVIMLQDIDSQGQKLCQKKENGDWVGHDVGVDVFMLAPFLDMTHGQKY